jgi:hypothetical protein
MKSQQTILWQLFIDTKLDGNEWSISLTASEQSILTMLRAAYGTLEAQLRDMANTRPGSLPVGLLNESLALLRCLVFDKLEPISGKHINLARNS